MTNKALLSTLLTSEKPIKKLITRKKLLAEPQMAGHPVNPNVHFFL